MSTTLRDQLLGLGFKHAPTPEPKSPAKASPPGARKQPVRDGGRPTQDKRVLPRSGNGRKDASPRHGYEARKPPRSREDIDLAKAYAIRAQREKLERVEAERLKQEEARKRREAKARLSVLLAGKGLNAADAENVRHFEYGGKIKRVHVTVEQLKALNAGELGVVQLDGRYMLVDAEMLAVAEATFAPAVALKVDPNVAAGDDPYADPQYRVPDYLIW